MKNKIKEDVLFSSVFHHSPIGLIILNSDSTLEEVNDYMFKFFKMLPLEVKGKYFGDIFKCTKFDRSELSCSKTDKCSHCDLRNGISSVLINNKSVEDIIFNEDFIIEGINETKWFMVSASLVTINKQKYAVISFSDITRQKQYEELLKLKLTLDMQTGTLNKYSLIEVLQNLVSEKNISKKVTISMIDFDDFKYINDTYGHLIGDKILEEFSTISFRNIRRSDILGRYGGEEFIFIFYETGLKKSLNILKRIQNEFKKFCFGEIGKELSFSAGVYEIENEKLKKMNKNDIIHYVDKYLYVAKRHGKNRIVSNQFEFEFK